MGSGAVESAIRRVINLRLKGPSIFWRGPNAERVLHMRAYLKAGDGMNSCAACCTVHPMANPPVRHAEGRRELVPLRDCTRRHMYTDLVFDQKLETWTRVRGR